MLSTIWASSPITRSPLIMFRALNTKKMIAPNEKLCKTPKIQKIVAFMIHSSPLCYTNSNSLSIIIAFRVILHFRLQRFLLNLDYLYSYHPINLNIVNTWLYLISYYISPGDIKDPVILIFRKSQWTA